MTRDWKPGDVAAFQANHVRSPLVIFRYHDHRSGRDEWMTADEGGAYPSDSASLRPLLVIDPEDREQVGRLADELYGIPALLQTDKVRDALRSLLAPTKPPEPLGLGAVVEDATGAEWVRVGLSDGFGGVWARVGATDNLLSGEVAVAVLPYGGIHVVRVLAEGRAADS